MPISEYSLQGMHKHHKAEPRVSIHTFTREQVMANDLAAFTQAYAVEALSPDALREAFNSLVIKFTGFELGPRGLYEDANARAFVRTLHEKWPHCLFYLNVPAADLKTYVLCRLTTLAVKRRSAGVPKITFSRNELFQVIGRDFDPLEKACQRAQFSPDVFRNRARQVLKFFGFLKNGYGAPR